MVSRELVVVSSLHGLISSWTIMHRIIVYGLCIKQMINASVKAYSRSYKKVMVTRYKPQIRTLSMGAAHFIQCLR
jgi:hypothetical protein